MLHARISIPQFAARIPNTLDVVHRMTSAVADAVRERTARGEGSRGPLPPPKDGGRALQRTGSLLASIGFLVQERSGRVRGLVRALGPRPVAERAQIKRKKAAAARRTRSLRAAARARGVVRVGSIRLRTVVDQGSLVAILSRAPRDKRARNGGRAIYAVFEATDRDVAAANRAAVGSVKLELPSTGTTVIGG